MPRLKDRNTPPPRGFTFHFPQLPNTKPHPNLSFKSLCDWVQTIINKNKWLAQKHNWPTDRVGIEAWVDFWNAKHLLAIGFKHFVDDEVGRRSLAAAIAHSKTISVNKLSPNSRPIVVRRSLALGDALAATVVASRLNELGYTVTFQGHPATHCILRRVPSIANVRSSQGMADVNLDNAYETHPQRRVKHFSELFFARAQDQLASKGINIGKPLNCRPSLVISDAEKKITAAKLKEYAKPWTFICPRSNSFAPRTVPDSIWEPAAKQIVGTKFWLGTHPAPTGIVDLQVRHVDHLLLYLSVADLAISPDTGPLHMAVAMGVQAIALGQSSSPELHLSDQRDWETIWPEGNLNCLNCQKNVCPINAYIPPCQHFDSQKIADAANQRLAMLSNDDVAAVVTIWKPDVKTLNQCLTALLPQVQSIIVTAEKNSVIPKDALQDPKIRYVQKDVGGIGYGRNCNFGARHSRAKYLMILNDDVFLDAGAVATLKREFTGNVGMVAHLLRYPDGTIYHAGKTRSPGVKGWGHIDHKKHIPTIKEPCDMENVCGASIMVSRKAFYDIGGFDEDFFLFAEDDDFALRMRKEGYRIRYTPHASGVHVEHQSVKKVADIMQLVDQANKTFGRKWGSYLDYNSRRIPGNFDYLKPAKASVTSEVSAAFQSLLKQYNAAYPVRGDSWLASAKFVSGIKGARIIETGCYHGSGADGGSTVLLAQLAKDSSGKLDSYELSHENIRLAQAELRKHGLEDVVTFHAGDSVESIASRDELIDFAYLDSWDCGAGPDYNPCQNHQLSELEAVLPLLETRAGVLLDDNVGAKGKTIKSEQRFKMLPFRLAINAYQLLYLSDDTGAPRRVPFCILSGHLSNYAAMARRTIYANKAYYAFKHGYDLRVSRFIQPQHQDAKSHSSGFTWSRLLNALELVESGDYEWLWIVGCDTMITNSEIKLQSLTNQSDKPTVPWIRPSQISPLAPQHIIKECTPVNGAICDGRAHLLIAGDCGAPVQADSFLVRCTPSGAAYLREILDTYETFKHNPWVENQAMIDLADRFAPITHIVPQHALNSYEYSLYEHLHPIYRQGKDCYGNRGQWQPGDFMVHWPAISFQKRMERINHFASIAV